MKFPHATFGGALAIGLALITGIALADTMPPAIGKPLLAAEQDLSAHRYSAALAELARADAVPGKTPDETLDIDQLRAAIDATRGDRSAAAADYATLIATGQLSDAQIAQMAAGEASMQYQSGNYAAAAATIKTYLPHDPQFHPLLMQAYYQLGNCAALDAELAPELKSAARTGQPPAQADLQMAAYCNASAKNTAGYVADITDLVQYYPTPAYWTDLLGQLQADPAYSDRLALDFFRLKLAVGVPATEPDYMEMTQEAVQQGLTNEATKIMAQGTAAGILGSGPDLDRQKRLQALVAQRAQAAAAGLAQQIAQAQAAGDQPTLFDIGFNEVEGGNPAGLTLMANAIRSGDLTQPGQAELELGMAYNIAGQRANARAMWNATQGGSSAAQLAKLWMLVK
jgi:hypothetical protein